VCKFPATNLHRLIKRIFPYELVDLVKQHTSALDLAVSKFFPGLL
jgi:hypothetical protein